ncbi:nucleotidyltransferase domain-containing protein [Candidatus Pacearchaeota archaeon]|nr:nucleotidyltransferase domain-containing protein [Candidatus Pacearchaeota archaeon]
MKKEINSILKKEIENIKLDKKTFDEINRVCREFIYVLKNQLKKKKIKAEVFLGGSLAKNTIIKKTEKDKYDIDIFVRFDKKSSLKKTLEKDNLSEILEKLLDKNAVKVHGSRDYYQFLKKNIRIEVIPVKKIKNPAAAENVTDLSYFHVNYVVNKTKKNRKLSNEIMLAKAFTYAQNSYGAESYIHGFSGYALELLICHYKSFLKFIEAVAKSQERIIIDDSKFYKKKEELLMEMNESKIISPIILIDPTFKERNALAGLSKETFEKFKKSCKDFLANPSSYFFTKKNIYDELKNNKNLKIISVKTSKQKGDIAGTKSKKFFDFFVYNIKKEFVVKNGEFEYDDEKNIAYFYLIVDKKNEEVIKGPPINIVEHLTGFKKAHPNVFIKDGISYAKIAHNLSFEEFLKRFLEKDKKIIKEMGVREVKIIDKK